MTEPFGEPGKDAEHFKYSLFLVLCNRLTSCAVAIFGLVVSWVLSSGGGTRRGWKASEAWQQQALHRAQQGMQKQHKELPSVNEQMLVAFAGLREEMCVLCCLKISK